MATSLNLFKSFLVVALLLLCLLTDIFAGPKQEFQDRSNVFLNFFDEHSSLLVDLDTHESTGKVFIQSSPSAFEPFLMLLQTNADLQEVSISSTDLISDKGVLDSRFVDFRIVKEWFQSGTAGEKIEYGNNRVLISELLLHDESVVRSDAGQNYVKLSDDGRYAHISSDKKITKWIFPESSTIPVRDSQKITPFKINRDEEKRVWLTIEIPDSAQPGTYSGEILISNKKLPRVSVPIEVRVLPFQLSKPDMTFSIYYRGQLQENRPTVSSDFKSRTQFQNELKNIKAHGIDSPSIFQSYSRDMSLFNVLKYRERAGISNAVIFYLGFNTGQFKKEKEFQSLEKKVSSVVNVCRTFDSKDIFFYGVEEVRGEKLLAQIPLWNRVKKAGGKVFIAGYPGTQDLVGDSLDLLIAKEKNLDSAAIVQKHGNRIFVHKPQGGIEDPLLYRKEYGYRLWASGYDGAMPYAYQHGFGHIWNDFDHSKYRDHNFTYPTIDGVIDTIQWEGLREGIDDIRYLATLDHYVQKSGDSAGRAFLGTIRLDEDIDPRVIRTETIKHLLRIVGENRGSSKI